MLRLHPRRSEWERQMAGPFSPNATHPQSTILNQQSFHPAALPQEQLLAQCEVERLRRSGPGGQHRNRVETAVRLTHHPSGITAMASERRSQSDNFRNALFRLRVQLALSLRTTRELKPSTLWKERCIGGRILINPKHDDFPTLLADALDLLASTEWNVPDAAQLLACTSSQLLKFLRHDPRALELVNERRMDQDLNRLK